MFALAIASSISGILNDFVYDDVPMIRDNDRVHHLAKIGTIFSHAYWPPPFVEQLYRPLTVTLFALEDAAGGGRPIVFRIVSYLLYAISALLVLRVASRLLPSRVALGVAILFAVHPVHVEAVALGVNQAELLIGIFSSWMVLRYVDARRRSAALQWSEWAALSAIYAAAMLTKESGFVLPLLLLAVELFLFASDSAMERARGLWRGYACLAAVSCGGLAIRATVLGHPVGAVGTRMLAGLGVGGRMLVMLQVVPTWLRLFAWPAVLSADYATVDFGPPSFGPLEIFGFALVCAVLVSIYALRRRAPVVSFGLAWCVVGLLPVSNVIPTGILLAERTLFLPSIGFLIAVGAAADVVMQRRPAPAVRRAIAVGAIGVAAFGVAKSLARNAAWNSAHIKLVPSAHVELRNRGSSAY
ncbi:MAG TPA: glycosyltransferase family 39 protein [Gemmatimonadaceae bacterium]|nr:glycosyltransferase family 39 protein [Gemmatimonadaceae bacterium]